MDEQYLLGANILPFHQLFVSIRVNETPKFRCIT